MKKKTRKRKVVKGPKDKQKGWKYLIKGISYLFLGVFVFAIAGLLAILLGMTGPLPGEADFESIDAPSASQIFDRNGRRIGSFALVDRSSIPLEKISPHVVHALVATEDERFYEHKGIDTKSLSRVFFKTILLGNEGSGGGSTLSQQLAKNLYPRRDYSFLSLPINKVREMIIASRLESYFTKDQILELYLNSVPFGENSYGIGAASYRFFGKKPADLTLDEAAVLVGLLKANTYYNPRIAPERATERRNVVLLQMLRNGYIEQDQYEEYSEKSLKLDYHAASSDKAFAFHFKEHVRKEVDSILNAYNVSNGSSYNLLTSGLKVRTTLDADLQKVTEKGVHDWMRKLQSEFDKQWDIEAFYQSNPKQLDRLVRRSPVYNELKQGGMSHREIMKEIGKESEFLLFDFNGPKKVNCTYIEYLKSMSTFLNNATFAMSPINGDVLAWVGSIDPQYFAYDHVASQPGRQPGSTFKPIVYTSALEQGVSPCKYIKASQESYEIEGKEYKPRNAGEEYEGRYSMEGALTNSVNTVAIKTIEEAGINNTISTARRMGIESELPEVSSLALGTASVSLYEMVAAYCVFANKGMAVKPRCILQIEDADGKVIYQAKDLKRKAAISPKAAMQMNHMLQEVVNNGTGRRLRTQFALNNSMGGKTGTTQNNADGWFICVLPRMVIGSWVGNDNPSIHFKSTALGQGAHTALPIVGSVITSCNSNKELAYIAGGNFDPLPETLARKMDCDPFKEELNLFERLFGKKGKEERQNKKERQGEGKKEKKGWFKKLFRKKN